MKTERPEVKKNKNMWMALWPLLFLVLAFSAGVGQSPLTRSMGITQHLGDTIPKDLMFKDETGKDVRLGEMLHGKPVLVVPIFYSCKTGCAILTDSIVKTLAKAASKDVLMPGRDFDVLMYSIDPVEDSELAHVKKAEIFGLLTPKLSSKDKIAGWRATAESGWHLLTGSKESILGLSNAIGFKYNYRTVPDLDQKTKLNLINHATCTVFLTPEGRISGYTIGTGFQTKEVEANQLLAKNGKIGKHADQSLMFGCIMVDPATGQNRLVIENVWKLGGVLTLLVLAASIVSMFIKNNRENSVSGGGLSVR